MAEPTERIAILLELQTEQANKNARKYAREIDRLERKHNPLAAAEEKLKKKQLEYNGALKEGTLTAKRHATAMDLLQREYDQSAERAKRLSSNVVALNSSVGAQTSFMSRNRSVFQQAGYQIGDFAVQVQGGQSALVAFTQQGTQMLGVFGAYGAIAGAALAVGAPLIASFLGSGEAAKEYEDVLEDLNASIKAYQDAVNLAEISTDGLNERFGEGSEILRQQILLLRDFALVKALNDAKTAAAALSEEYAHIFDGLNSGARSGELAKTIRTLREEFNLTREQGVQLRDALADIGRAEGLSETSARAGELNALLIDIYGSAADVPEQFAEMAVAAGNTVLRTLELEKTVDDTRTTVFEMVQAMAASAGAISDAIGPADALLGRIQSLAAAAWDYAGAMGASAVKGGRGSGAEMEDGRRVFREQLKRQTSRKTPTRSKARKSGGGSRSGGSKVQAPLLDISEGELLNLQRQIDMIGKSKGEIAALTTKHKLLDEAKKRGLTITGELTEKIDAESAEVGQLADKYDQARDKIAAMEQIQGQFKDSVIDAAMGGADAFDNFKDAIKRAALEYALFGSGLFAGGSKSSGGGLLGGLFGGGGGGGFLGGLFNIGANANGTSNWRGGLTSVNERGGEIMNLPQGTQIIPNDISKRMADNSSGGGSMDVRVYVDDDGNWQAKVEQISGGVVHQAAPDLISRSVQATGQRMSKAPDFGAPL